MTGEEIDSFLRSQGHGVLSLANENDAYSVPISFGYDGEQVFLTLIQFGETSEKIDFVESTNRASMTVYDIETRFDWRSVNVVGTLSEVPESEFEYVEEIMDENSWHPSLFPPTDAMTDVRWLALDIEETTGRQGEEHQ
jgi:nitroimidazol reductase NimA-like FMN-containing flavoprotein (pyridoxamine 5'-phosphate oxidase superfamily)